MKIYLSRHVKLPTRGTPMSAGLDFYVPYSIRPLLLIGEHKRNYVMPGESIKIPLGIHLKIPAGKALVFFNKSGVCLKTSLVVGACVIDEDYQGEVHAHLINAGDQDIDIPKEGDKIIQGLLLDVDYRDVETVDSLEALYGGVETERGTGGFGSTGT